MQPGRSYLRGGAGLVFRQRTAGARPRLRWIERRLGRFATIVWGENVSNPLSFGVTLGWANNLID